MVNQQPIKQAITEVIGVAQVKKVFTFSRGNIAGFRVMKGKIKRNNSVQVWRNQQKIFTGEIKSLESNKVEKNEVNSGQECGIVLKGFEKFQKGDKIVAFQLVKKKILMINLANSPPKKKT